MTDEPKMSKQEAIDKLRKEAQALEDKFCSIKEYASNAHKVKIRRNVADRLEQELEEEKAKNKP